MDVNVSKVVKGDIILIKNHLSRVISIQINNPSKMGSRKYCILGKSIENDNKYFQVFRQGDICSMLISSEELKNISI